MTLCVRHVTIDQTKASNKWNIKRGTLLQLTSCLDVNSTTRKAFEDLTIWVKNLLTQWETKVGKPQIWNLGQQIS